MNPRFAALCAGLLILTGCTGQAEPAVVVNKTVSPSAVESSSVPEFSSGSETLDTAASSSEMESASESVAAASEPESSNTVESENEPAVSSKTQSSSTLDISSTAEPFGSAEPSGMPESSSEPVDSSAAELSSEPEPPSSDLDKIPPGEPVEPLTPPPPLTPEQEEEERATRERLRLVDRAYALSKQVEKILPPDIFGGWAEVKQSLPVVLEVYVVDQAAASEILESYADPEIPFSYSIVKFSKSEMDAMIADLWEEEIIQKNKDKIYDISPDYWVADGYIEIDLFEPWPELNAWLEGYTSAAEITINDGTKEKTNPA